MHCMPYANCMQIRFHFLPCLKSFYARYFLFNPFLTIRLITAYLLAFNISFFSLIALLNPDDAASGTSPNLNGFTNSDVADLNCHRNEYDGQLTQVSFLSLSLFLFSLYLFYNWFSYEFAGSTYHFLDTLFFLIKYLFRIILYLIQSYEVAYDMI